MPYNKSIKTVTFHNTYLVYISSLAACFPFSFRGAYSASKAYTSTAFKCLQKQFARHEILFSIIYAGLLDTKMSSGVNIPIFFKYPVSRAAKVVLKVVESGASSKYFPLRTILLEWFLILLPNNILLRFMSRQI